MKLIHCFCPEDRTIILILQYVHLSVRKFQGSILYCAVFVVCSDGGAGWGRSQSVLQGTIRRERHRPGAEELTHFAFSPHLFVKKIISLVLFCISNIMTSTIQLKKKKYYFVTQMRFLFVHVWGLHGSILGSYFISFFQRLSFMILAINLIK